MILEVLQNSSVLLQNSCWPLAELVWARTELIWVYTWAKNLSFWCPEFNSDSLASKSVPQGGPRGPSDLILDTFGVILEALGHMFGPFFGNCGCAWRQFRFIFPVILEALGPDVGPFFPLFFWLRCFWALF